mmetsp:Transcript_54709/g.61170  ORF Transcript_54709/g.61170 Transcript_54709/m.61170 type:complete len:82 (+) Transcript_54709:11-256(+)
MADSIRFFLTGPCRSTDGTLFLQQYRNTFVEMSDNTDFQTFVDATVASFLEKNKNLGEESSRYWHVILNQTYDFSRVSKTG